MILTFPSHVVPHYWNVSLSIQLLLLILFILAHSSVETDILKSVC
jgi:hypothetical protein